MSEITIDSAKAERMVAQILRNDASLLPSQANELAANICRRLSSAMSTPTHAPLQGCRLIRKSPPYDSDFTAAVRKRIANIDDAMARELWELVFDRALDLPATMADSTRI
jgi:hypothetical protein